MRFSTLIVSLSLLTTSAAIGAVDHAFLQTPPPARPQAPRPPQGQQPPAQAPAVLRVEPPVIDLGRVPPSTHHPVSFVVRNVSPQPVKILEAKPSCKCTTFASIAGRVLAPGAMVKIDATMDAPSMPGPKDAQIFIVVEGVERPVIAMIKSVVVMPIEADPPFVDIRENKLRAIAKIAAADGKPFRVLSAGGKAPVFADASGQPISAPTEPQSSYVLVSDFTGVPAKELMQYWVVETDRADCPIVPVQVRHELTGIRFDPTAAERRWLWSEALVNAGRINAGEPFLGTVEIAKYDPPKVTTPMPSGWSTVQSVRSLSPLATVELDKAEPRGDKVSVHFRLTPKPEASGKCIYIPIEVKTASGSGRFFVTASVSSAAPAAPPAGGTR